MLREGLDVLRAGGNWTVPEDRELASLIAEQEDITAELNEEVDLLNRGSGPPYIRGSVSIVPNPLAALVAAIDSRSDSLQTYVVAMQDILNELADEAEDCAQLGVQTCLTAAFEEASASANLIVLPRDSRDRADVHTQLATALAAMLEIHRTAETVATPSAAFMRESEEALDAFADALERWNDTFGFE